MTPAVVLTIAGSDSGGGAGLQADLRTFAAHGVHGACAVAAVTAQNTVGVDAVVALDAAFVTAQVTSVVADLTVRAVKTGMLAEPATVRAVAGLAGDGVLPNLVVDPVLVSSSGHPLLSDGGVGAYRLLLPHAAVVTPNLGEAALLTGRTPGSVRTVDDMAEAAEELLGLGAGLVVVKGGHLGPGGGGRPGTAGADAPSPDVVASAEGVVVLEGGRVLTGNDHGTGCTLSAAIAAGLALGETPLEAVRRAKAYVRRALSSAATWRLGAGHGPLDQLVGATPTGATGLGGPDGGRPGLPR